MSTKSTTCQGQHESLTAWTRPVRYPGRVYKLLWQLRRYGPTAAFRTVITRIRRRIADQRAHHAPPSAVAVPGEVLNLQAQEWVRVKPEQEILATLDTCGRNKGLAWIPCMSAHCGKEYRVYKRVERIILESTGEIRKARNTVLLEGVVCDGLYGCDRSCFPFWREAWLERVDRGENR
jgi:hypothetical protein